MNKYVSYLAGLIIIVFYPFLAFFNGDRPSFLSGWLVPDGVTLFNSARVYANYSINEVVYLNRINTGEVVFNSILVGAHIYAPALINAILLIVASFLLLKKTRFNLAFIVFFIPYYVVSLPLPSKDIIVLLIFAISLIFFLDERCRFGFAISLFCCFLLFFFRDGFALILGATLIVTNFAIKFRIKVNFIILSSLIASSIFWVLFKYYLNESFIATRTFALAKTHEHFSFEFMTSFVGYFVKLIGNSTNLAFRPQMIDVNGGFYILGLAFWISGVTLLATFYFGLIALRSINIRDVKIGMIIILPLILLSIVPFVQPRYLLPLILLMPLLSFVTVARFVRTFVIFMGISIIALFVYRLVGFYPDYAYPLLFTVE